MQVAKRLGRICIAFLLSSFFAGVILGLLTYGFVRPVTGGALDFALRVLGICALIGLLVAAIALIPSAVGIAVAEWRGIRSAGYYAAGGAVVPLFFYGPMIFAGMPASLLGGVALTCGLGALSGLVYWYVAGSGAGTRGGVA
jgi:hypothetical protein